jgi:predicted enzyme related to lactoylglutathione lyase
MPTPDIKPGSPCWIDLMTSDTAKARDFYGELFGWQFQSGDQELYGGYITAFKNGKIVAGIMQKQEDQAGFPDMWSTYLCTDDAAATAASVPSHGGQVYMEPMDVPAQGIMAYFADPSGASVGAWQRREMRGYEIAAEPGTPAWHELHAKDYQGAVEFYESVFGWQTSVMSDAPDFRYTTLGAGETAQAGIMDASGYLPTDVPSHWQVYFAAEDTDALAERAMAMGGAVLDGPADSDFGRVAQLADPMGGMFKVISSPSASARVQ